jgi:hypothetical protein
MKDLEIPQKAEASSPGSTPGTTLLSSPPPLPFSASDGEKVDEARMRWPVTVEPKVEVSTPGTPPPAFPRCPGETPRAFSAFQAFFGLGQARSLQALAEQLGEKPDTLKNWSSRFGWRERIQSFNSGLLQQQAEAEAASRAQQTADWARRTSEYREQEWVAAQKLLGAVQCFLESFGDRDVEKMTLAQVSRALQISSRIARQALRGSSVPDEPVLAPVQVELTAALDKAYAQPPPAAAAMSQNAAPVASHP